MVPLLGLRDKVGVDCGLDRADGLAVCFEDEGVEVEASAFLLTPGILGFRLLQLDYSG